MFTFIFGFACGAGAYYAKRRFGEALKLKLKKIETALDKQLRDE